jgi:hypothetical protein
MALHCVRSLLGAWTLAASLITVATGAGAAELPASVTASYEVEFNGIAIGGFNFESKMKGQSYSLASTGKLSLLFGTLKWSGEARATGQTVGEQTRPQSFSYGFRGTRKPGAIRMTYTGDTVTSVVHEPPRSVKPENVPVEPAHLKAVLDPMSATLVLTKGAAGNPCNKRLPVYDGKERFDLQFISRGTTQIKEKTPSGQPVTAFVCRVKYIPISGHKPNDETKAMSRSDGIEIVLRPIPSANIYVPYVVTIPTMIGNIAIYSRQVEITMAGQQQIALKH